MRAMILALGFLLTAGGAAAQIDPYRPREAAAPGRETTRLRLPQPDALSYRRPADDGEANIPARDERASRFETLPNILSVGAFKLALDNDGVHRHFARVQLEDGHVLGGNISGTFDGRGGALRLSWPMGN